MGNPLQATHRHLFAQHRFRCPIDRVGSADWTDCQGLDFSIAKMEYFEGGAEAARKEAGRVSFEDLVLSRGVSYDMDLWTWAEEVVDMQRAYPYGAGEVSPAYKRNGRVQQLERDRSKAIVYKFYDGFPIKFGPASFDNNTDAIQMEQITLTYFYNKRQNLGTPPSASAP